MLTELNGKGGCLCEPARKGELRCPLIVRPTSEDVVTGNLFGTLRALNPRWWLPDLLNKALGAERFRRQVFRDLTIDLWQTQRSYPRHRLPWDEGHTEVDVVITWENPPTTVFIEMKYGSTVSPGTVHNNGTTGYPSDQLIRNARVGLWETGWFPERRLFEMKRRDFVLVLLAPSSRNRLVEQYRNPMRLRHAIPYGQRLTQLPRTPFIGELSYRDVLALLAAQRRWFTRPERIVVDQLSEYLLFKLSHLRTMHGQG